MDADVNELFNHLYYASVGTGLAFNAIELYETKMMVLNEMLDNQAIDSSGHAAMVDGYQFILCSELITSEALIGVSKANIKQIEIGYNLHDYVQLPSESVDMLLQLMNEIAEGIKAFTSVYENYDFTCGVDLMSFHSFFLTTIDDVLYRFNLIYSDEF